MLEIALIDLVVVVTYGRDLLVLTTHALIGSLSERLVSLNELSEAACIRIDVRLNLVITKGFTYKRIVYAAGRHLHLDLYLTDLAVENRRCALLGYVCR